MTTTSSTASAVTGTLSKMPKLIYGTAWKAERTTELVVKAVRNGFRGVDTATQPKHYTQLGIGKALKTVEKEDGTKRDEIFLQTKFTSLDGQDMSKPLPYDRSKGLREQARQSLQTALKELETDWVDSLVLHSPIRGVSGTLEVWKEFEEFVKNGTVKILGISNIYDPDLLRQIIDEVEIKPSVIQNRFYAQTGYDYEILEICKQHRMVYQSFWTLTANPNILKSPILSSLAASLQETLSLKSPPTPAQTFFHFLTHNSRGYDIRPLTGTTNEERMTGDLDAVLQWGEGGEEWKRGRDALEKGLWG